VSVHKWGEFRVESSGDSGEFRGEFRGQYMELHVVFLNIPNGLNGGRTTLGI
jgi:hypothetical protein